MTDRLFCTTQRKNCLEKELQDFWSRWRCRRHTLPPHATIERINNYISKSITSRTVRKLSCMEVQQQGFKGATFIQMGGRGAELWRWAERPGVMVWCAEAVVVAAEGMIPHSWKVDKKQEAYFGNKQSQPQARPHSPRFQLWEDKSP